MSRKIIADLGNTRIKWTELGANEEQGNIAYHEVADSQTLFSIWQKMPFDTLIYSNVSSITEAEIRKILPDKKLIEITGRTPSALKMGYKSPDTLGSDRYLGALGAYAEFKGRDILLVDFGTCIKYEKIDAEGTYLGGAISPGIEMRFKAMHTFTGKLPLFQHQKPKFPLTPIGQNTEESMYTGVFQGILGEIKQFIHMNQQAEREMCVIFSGGFAEDFAVYLENHIFVRPNIVLSGLQHIVRYNNY